MLLALEVLSLAGLAVATAAFLEGARSIVVFLLLVAFFVAWGAQAVHAHRSAAARGGDGAGAILLFLLIPVAILAFTGFWLLAGAAATPEATVQRYVAAWQDGHPERARPLFAAPITEQVIGETWQRHGALLRERLTTLREQLGPGSEIEPENPFRNLIFVTTTPAATHAADGRAEIEIRIVRREREPTLLFGLFPAATQRSVAVEEVARAVLVAVDEPVMPLLDLRDRVWRVESFRVGAGPLIGGDVAVP